MRFAPRSLFGRLVLVLMAGLVVAQILSLAIHAEERGRVLAQASGMQSAQRIADIVNVLEPLAPAERRRLAGVLSAPPLMIRFEDRSVSPPRVDAESRTHAAFFESLLSRYLGEQRLVSVSVTDAAPWTAAAKMHRPEGWGMHRGWMGAGPGMQTDTHGGMSFVATVRLRDDTVLVFDTRQPRETLSWPYRVLGSLAILLLAVIAISLIAVRWMTRPLETLADAAEKLGNNIHRPPLDETGPREVERAARAFNTMQAKLIGYLRDRTRILAAMSHDLKTPITRLRLRAELLHDAQLKSKFETDLRELEAMVSRTLDFMRGVDSEERIQPVDIDALVQSLQRDMQETGCDVALEGHSRAPYPGRPQALKRCLANLLDNAVKYGHSARVAIDDDDECLRIRISDRGPGIPPDALERVFEPFYRLEESRNRDTGGTGLGLSIARSIAQAHGGTLILRNRTQGGLEAVLNLPRR
jgi:signal transduction histidine kinase